MIETKSRDTEIGEISEDLNAIPISKVCKVKRGVRIAQEQLMDNGIPVKKKS